MKKRFIFFSLIISIGLFFQAANAQELTVEFEIPKQQNAEPSPTPPKLANSLAENLEKNSQDKEISRERREQAYAKLLEGQRFIWSMRRVRSTFSIQTSARLAKNALKKAVELDPNLAEAYTALAELALTSQPQDIDEAIMLSEIAVKLDKDNFGGHRFLARLFTIKSNLGSGRLNSEYSEKAVKEWKEITRLDSRNAEGWAFLSAFYKETDQSSERIEALRNWLSSSTPLETGFYSRVMAREGDLSNENASVKLGEALIEAGKTDEAVSVLTRAVSDSPENLEAVELLSQALENADKNSLKPAIEALRQAVYSNSDNLSLIELLAKTIAKSGNIDEASKYLKDLVFETSEKDSLSASSFLVTLGDIYSDVNRTDEAIRSYKDALQLRGIGTQELATDDERDFAFLVINKMIETYKKAGRFDDARLLIETSRVLFGNDDLTLDREYVQLLRASGNRDLALKAVRAARVNSPFDYSLIRLEAEILTDLGKVDEGVGLIKTLIEKKPENVAPSIMYDDFENYYYISKLYIQAKRNKEAVDAANLALSVAKRPERKQIGKMALATAQQSGGNFAEAEKLLLELLEETPGNPYALNNLGYLYLESGKKYEEALELISKAIKIDPRNPHFLDSLGWAYFKLGKFTEAEKYLAKALKLDPSSATIFEHLGDVYIKIGKSQKAKEAWQKALKYSMHSEDVARLETKLSQ